MSPTLHELITLNVDHPALPPLRRAAAHPLREHLMFMEDPDGQAVLGCTYMEILRGAGLPVPAPDPQWKAPGTPAIRTSLALLPKDGLLRHDWIPDGRQHRRSRNSLQLGDQVFLNGETLDFSVDQGVYDIKWPEDLGLNLLVEGPAAGDLLLTPRIFNFKPMLAEVDLSWLEDTDLDRDWGACVWDFQRICVLWHALARLEPVAPPVDQGPGNPAPPYHPPFDPSEALQQPETFGDAILYYLSQDQPLSGPAD